MFSIRPRLIEKTQILMFIPYLANLQMDKSVSSKIFVDREMITQGFPKGCLEADGDKQIYGIIKQGSKDAMAVVCMHIKTLRFLNGQYCLYCLCHSCLSAVVHVSS
jgi:hypothetical protein